MVLGDASQQLGPSLLILGHFFFPSVGLGIDMKWTGLCQILQPHNNNKKIKKKMGKGEKKYKFLETCIKLCLHFIVLF